MGIKEDLKRAIDARNTISFDYKGHPRIAEPYHYGVVTQTPQCHLIKKPQETSLLCYQIGGTSHSNQKSGKPIAFKIMLLSEIKNLKINEDRKFLLRSDYNSDDERWIIEHGVSELPNYKL